MSPLFNRVNVILQKVTYVDMYAYIMFLDSYGGGTKESARRIHRPLQIRIRGNGLFFLFFLYIVLLHNMINMIESFPKTGCLAHS